MGFELIEWNLLASDFHALDADQADIGQIWWNHITKPALVLGSAQRDPQIVDVDACHRAGVDVARRRSGGGAVLLTPGDVGWIDVIIPNGAHGWDDDVHATMVWLGEHLAAVIGEALRSPSDDAAEQVVTVNRAGMIRTDWSRLICFDGVGPGEVLLNGDKLVGISQRRTRHTARLQVLWYSRYDPTAILQLLSPQCRPNHAALQPVATIDSAVSAAIPRLLRERLGAPTRQVSRNGEEMGSNG